MYDPHPALARSESMRESTLGPKPNVCTVKGLCEHLICVDSFFSAFSGWLSR